MPEKLLPQAFSDTDNPAAPAWLDSYDMSTPDTVSTPAPDVLPISTPAPASTKKQRLARLEVWSTPAFGHFPRLLRQFPAAPSADTQTETSTSAAESARSAHLKVMGELTVSIAHEISQPLLAIASNTAACIRWLQRDTPRLEEAICGLNDIRSECERAASIVTSLRALAKQTPAKPRAIKINEIIEEVIRLKAAVLTWQGVTVETVLRADKTVIADPVQIQQLVFNLMTNALEAMSANTGSAGILRVSSCALRDGIQVSIEDNGPGIPVQERKKIFGAFYTTRTSGLGMGLTICRSVVEAHDGALYVEASDLGGACFRFNLPSGCKNH
ncbi:sensor histidine kinase [Pseudomonas sp. NPDC090203]|uniref:sensor histidine kinase n=1 Tax=Pseudomonas sp. NPDC090203 TaxID=3364477 RepID=UPI00382EB2D1